MLHKGLEIWVIYQHPLDYPNHYVARMHIAECGKTKSTDQFFLADTLEGIRGKIPEGLCCCTRDSMDDPNIVESWI